MLDVLRRLFDFSDWEVNHPAQPAPGDMLDASFDAQNAKINEIVDILAKIVRSDGSLTPNVVHLDAFPPEIVDLIVHESLVRLGPGLLASTSAAAAAESAKIVATAAQNATIAAENRILAAIAGQETETQAARDEISRVNALLEARSLEIDAKTAAYVETDNDIALASALAQDWAQVSVDWAEYMPWPIPPNTLAVMGVTGNHWSSRWWASKAANAFGAMTELYLGMFASPPTTTATGEPIPPGAIYYNSTTHQMYVWTGAQWESMWSPSRAVSASLFYLATTNQTIIDMKLPDMNGSTFTLTPAAPEAIQPMINGVRLVPQGSGPEGDYVVNNSTSVVTLNRALRAGDMIGVDILMPPSALVPVQSLATKLDQLVFNGSTTVFALLAGGNPVTPQKAESLVVSLDGVVQEPGVAYTLAGSSIIFTPAPETDVKSFVVFLGK